VREPFATFHFLDFIFAFAIRASGGSRSTARRTSSGGNVPTPCAGRNNIVVISALDSLGGLAAISNLEPAPRQRRPKGRNRELSGRGSGPAPDPGRRTQAVVC